MGRQSAPEDIATEASAKLFRERAQIENPVGAPSEAGSNICAPLGGGQVARLHPSFPDRKRDPGSDSETDRRTSAGSSVREAEMLLARVDGARFQGIAKEMGLHHPSIGSMMARAVNLFKKRLEDRHGTR